MESANQKETYRRLADKYFDAVVGTASEMIRIPSMSGEEREMAEYAVAKMKELGYDEVKADRAGNIVGIMRGTGAGRSVMLNCHLDTVHEGPRGKWTHPPFSGAIADGMIWGRGASDTKGAFAAQIYAPHILKQEGLLPKGDVYVVGVVHEESAGFGAMIMAQDGFFTDYAIMGEASENDIAVACRGRIGLEVLITGKSCHAGLPSEGVNPFAFLGKFLIALNDYVGLNNPKYGSSLLSPTRILSSEAGTNVIPNWVRLSLDYRSVPGETNEGVIAKLEKIAESCAVEGVRVEIKAATVPLTCYTGMTGEGFQGEPPYGIDEADDTVVLAKAALEEAYGRAVKTKPWAFATDSGHFGQRGVKVIGFSPAEIKKCHTVEDNLSLEMLKDGIVGNLALVKAFCDQQREGA
ncbi:MAG: M20/M25/M40 family metallo-hydrolase [Deltaproteobacteria bacterium]|jgi:putative selenium metabolism hydrolase|nr:M20/M25/M40 family metallo-hydrolase [Deltaproteobacteria bacterium]